MLTEDRPSPREVFAARLRATRRARGFRTAKSFAEALGIEQNTYTRYERGEVEPNIAVIERIWAVLALSPTELFGHSAAGLKGGPGRADAQPRVPVDPRDASAWTLASTYVRAASPARRQAAHAELRRIASVFTELTAQPYETAGRLALDPGLDAADPQARDAFATALARFTKLLDQDPSPRRRRDAADRSAS